MHGTTLENTAAVKEERTVTRVLALKAFLKNDTQALASVAQLVGASSCNQRVVGSIPSHDTYLNYGFGP